MVAVVLRNLNREVARADLYLARKARERADAPSRIEMVELVVVGLCEAVEPLANDDMARGAGTVEFAGVLNLDAVRDERSGKICARLNLKLRLFLVSSL